MRAKHAGARRFRPHGAERAGPGRESSGGVRPEGLRASWLRPVWTGRLAPAAVVPLCGLRHAGLWGPAPPCPTTEESASARLPGLGLRHFTVHVTSTSLLVSFHSNSSPVDHLSAPRPGSHVHHTRHQRQRAMDESTRPATIQGTPECWHVTLCRSLSIYHPVDHRASLRLVNCAPRPAESGPCTATVFNAGPLKHPC